MISITKDESLALREKFRDDVCIAITSRHKKGGRKHYYTEETSRVLYFLKRFREKQIRNKKKKKGSNV